MNYTSITLGELLSHANEIIKRNAISILKQLQKKKEIKCFWCKKELAIMKDWREIDGTTGSYPSCKKCYNLPLEEVMRIQNEWYTDNIPF